MRTRANGKGGPIGLVAFLACALVATAAGEVQTNWEYVYPYGQAVGYGVAVTPQRNIFIAGSSYADQVGSSDSRPLVVCLSGYGVPYWSTTFIGTGTGGGENAARAIALHPSGDLVVAGQIWSGAGTGSDGWVARITQWGAVVWEQVVNGSLSQADAFEAVAVNQSTGRIFAVGRQTRCVSNAQLWMVRFDENGTKECEYTLIPDVFCRAASAYDACIDDATGEVYVAGYITTGSQGQDIWVGKFSGACGAAPIWSATINGLLSSTDYGAGIALDSSGNPIVVGSLSVAERFLDIWAAKLDSATGSILWSLTLDGGEGDNDSGLGCAVDSSGTVYLTGYVDRRLTGAFEDLWLAGVSPLGSTMWELDRNYYGNDTDIGRRVEVDAGGRIYVVGRAVDAYMQTRLYLGVFSEYLPLPAGTGAGADGPYPAPNPVRDLNAGVTFRGLPAGATVKVFSLAGALIAEMPDGDQDGVVVWAPVANKSGGLLASGVYIYLVVPKSGDVSRGKVVIVR